MTDAKKIRNEALEDAALWHEAQMDRADAAAGRAKISADIMRHHARAELHETSAAAMRALKEPGA